MMDIATKFPRRKEGTRTSTLDLSEREVVGRKFVRRESAFSFNANLTAQHGRIRVDVAVHECDTAQAAANVPCEGVTSNAMTVAFHTNADKKISHNSKLNYYVH